MSFFRIDIHCSLPKITLVIVACMVLRRMRWDVIAPHSHYLLTRLSLFIILTKLETKKMKMVAAFNDSSDLEIQLL